MTAGELPGEVPGEGQVVGAREPGRGVGAAAVAVHAEASLWRARLVDPAAHPAEAAPTTWERIGARTRDAYAGAAWGLATLVILLAAGIGWFIAVGGPTAWTYGLVAGLLLGGGVAVFIGFVATLITTDMITSSLLALLACLVLIGASAGTPALLLLLPVLPAVAGIVGGLALPDPEPLDA